MAYKFKYSKKRVTSINNVSNKYTHNQWVDCNGKLGDDYDYIKDLPKSEREEVIKFMNKFNREIISGCKLNKDSLHGLEFQSELYLNNNAKNRCVMSKGSIVGDEMVTEEWDESNTPFTAPQSYAEAMLEFLDTQAHLSKEEADRGLKLAECRIETHYGKAELTRQIKTYDKGIK